MAITKPPVLPSWAEAGDKVQPSNAEIQVGWPLSSIPPSRQRFNWLLNFLANGIRYFSRRGLPDYDAAETYMIGDRIIGNDGKTYRSLVDNNINQIPSISPTKWEIWAPTLGDSDARYLQLSGGQLTGTISEAMGASIEITTNTLNLNAAGNFCYANVTAGAQVVTSLGVCPAGTLKHVFFTLSAGATLAIQFSGSSLYLPGGNTINVGHGDFGVFRSIGGGNWVCEGYTRAQGGGVDGVGSVVFVAASTAPVGYLKCNGAAISRKTYSALFSVIGTAFGAGDGSNTFNLPDLRGEFVRGLDDGRGIDSGRTLGSFQYASLVNGEVVDAIAGFRRINNLNPKFFETSNATDAIAMVMSTSTTTLSTPAANSQYFGAVRPRNIAMLACIKF